MSDWALCVGIGAYDQDSKLEKLPGALHDAQAIHKWLIDPRGGNVPLTQAKLICSPEEQDQNDLKPLAESIEGFLSDRFRDAERNRQKGNGFVAGRRLWLYFSGHGIGFPDEDNDTGLLVANSNPDLRDFKHVAGRAWADVFRITRAFEEVVLFMDCCRLNVNRTALRRPAVQTLLADPKGKMMAAFAVSPSKAAYETVSTDGVPRGKFTSALEELLRHPSKTPLSAREFLDELELKTPDFDPLPPTAMATDFVLLPAQKSPTEIANGPLLVVHGETTAELAVPLAKALETAEANSQVRQASDILLETQSDAFHSITELVVTRDVNLQELRDLIAKVQPERTVLYSWEDPGVTELADVRFVQRPDTIQLNISEQANRVAAALTDEPGFLEVFAIEKLARISVWNQHQRLMANGFGSLQRFSVPSGTYHIRASLGPHHIGRTVEVLSNATEAVELPAFPLNLPSPETLLTWKPVDSVSTEKRTIFEGRLAGVAFQLSAPRIKGWRFEAFSHDVDKSSDFSVRLVPDSHPPGARHEMDMLRETLRLALAERSSDAKQLTVEEVKSDPLCSLLGATLKLKYGEPPEDFVNAAATVLGNEDVDIRLLRGAAKFSEPPLLSFPWYFRLKHDQLNVNENSLADRLAGRFQMTEPWLTWTPDTGTPDRNWLSQVANVAWPGWDVEPKLELALSNISDWGKSFGVPGDSLERRTYKSPPVDKLVKHHKIAFLGASNGQLPAALAVAFVERGRKKWKRLEVWSLADDWLSRVESDGYTPARLVAARDHAEQMILRLLRVVAEDWSVCRYRNFEVPHLLNAETNKPDCCFASLWDWQEDDGFIHISPYKQGTNVRTSEYRDVFLGEEPELYRLVLKAFQDLQPVEVIGRS